MKKLFKSPWAWCVVSGIVLFAVSGLLMRGNALNECFPGGIVGWIFWGILILLALHFLIRPFVGFVGLPQWKSEEEQAGMNDFDRLLFLEKYAKSISKTQAVSSFENASLLEKLRNLENALHEMHSSSRLELLEKSVPEFREALHKEVCSPIISAHMKYAAVAVVVSQRGILDAFVVFALQVKLIIALSRAMGHRPSWAFVSCCMVWVISNSLISLIFDETKITETALSSLSEILRIQSGGLLGEIPGLKTIANLSMQALTAASSVYITGELVRSRLLGNAKKKTIKELLKIRVDGYNEAGKIATNIIGGFFGAKSTENDDSDKSATTTPMKSPVLPQ